MSAGIFLRSTVTFYILMFSRKKKWELIALDRLFIYIFYNGSFGSEHTNKYKTTKIALYCRNALDSGIPIHPDALHMTSPRHSYSMASLLVLNDIVVEGFDSIFGWLKNFRLLFTLTSWYSRRACTSNLCSCWLWWLATLRPSHALLTFTPLVLMLLRTASHQLLNWAQVSLISAQLWWVEGIVRVSCVQSQPKVRSSSILSGAIIGSYASSELCVLGTERTGIVIIRN